MKASLDDAEVDYIELGGAVPNPRLSLVYEGIELAKKEGVDFILAVGGGSAIDSAKAIGYGVANEGDVWDFYDRKRQATGCLPIGVVLTIAATGSEMSNSSVITKEEGWIKRGYSSDYGRPRFAIMNPELTMTLPDYQTACGCTDILMHVVVGGRSEEKRFGKLPVAARLFPGVCGLAYVGFRKLACGVVVAYCHAVVVESYGGVGHPFVGWLDGMGYVGLGGLPEHRFLFGAVFRCILAVGAGTECQGTKQQG